MVSMAMDARGRYEVNEPLEELKAVERWEAKKAKRGGGKRSG